MSGELEFKRKVLSESSRLGVEEPVRVVLDRFLSLNSGIFGVKKIKDVLQLFKDFSKKEGFFAEINAVVENILGNDVKIHGERETRRRIFKIAEIYGVDKKQVEAVFNKYDTMLKDVRTEEERAEVARLGAMELHALLDVTGPLVIDGVEIVSKKQDHVEDINNGVKLISE